MSIEIILEDTRWRGLERTIEHAVEATLTHMELEPANWDITVLGCNDARITELNGDFREKAKPTNVLSWPNQERGADVEGARPLPPEGDPELGDIAISFETCDTEAKAGGISLKTHTTHLVVHGVLHLLGYDHVRDGDADLMEALEIAILAKLGVANPYIIG